MIPSRFLFVQCSIPYLKLCVFVCTCQICVAFAIISQRGKNVTKRISINPFYVMCV